MAGTTRFPIATLDLATGGRIGVCPIPGFAGALDSDLETVFAWDPALTLSMTERKEMVACGIEDFGTRLRERGKVWRHLPIHDFGGLSASSAKLWPDLSKQCHDVLDQGGNVLLHCRGGKGRSGMIALRLMVERGEDPDDALIRLRDARPGAVETEEQRLWAQKRN